MNMPLSDQIYFSISAPGLHGKNIFDKKYNSLNVNKNSTTFIMRLAAKMLQRS
jgi:hypothetical protein